MTALPSVLVPRFDLGVCEIEFGCQLHAILDAQVFLPLEAAFQGLELVIGECSPRSIIVREVFKSRVPIALSGHVTGPKRGRRAI